MNMGAFGLLTALGLVGDQITFDDLRGLGWKRPAMGISAAIFMLSLAGIPPMGGFYGKYMIFRELVATGHVGMAILGVLPSCWRAASSRPSWPMVSPGAPWWMVSD